MFFVDVVLGRGLMMDANKERGRLRSLILKALKNFVIDQNRRERARANGAVVSLDGLELEEAIIAKSSSSDPDDAFDRRWALANLHEALRRCEEHFRMAEKTRNWEVFAAREILPRRSACEPVPLERLATELGFKSAADAAQAVQTVKKRMLAILREVVAETTSGESEADREFEFILSLLT